MNLPFVLDVVIGVVFIYLILSLLASEIQELITTLLQWRAKHLKESIENLLSGNSGAEATGTEAQELQSHVRALTDKIYNDPLLKNINQEARGILPIFFRKITWVISGLLRYLFRWKHGVFGNRRSGPSYIASDTFATTLLETLNIADLIEKLSQARLEKFAQRLLSGMTDIAAQSNQTILQPSFEILQAEYADIVGDFKTKQSTLLTCIDRLSESLEIYIHSYPPPAPEDSTSQYFIQRMQAFKQGIFGRQNERAILSGGLQPTITEIVSCLDTASQIHAEIKQQFGDLSNPESEASRAYDKLKLLLDQTPQPVKESLAILARRAKTRKQQAENEFNQLREEVALWFDRSMSRTSGVYKRNAKGVAILIGFAIALATNADTLHIFHRLSNDESLRQVITQRAAELSSNYPSGSVSNQQVLETLKNETDAVLKDISLPLSWNPSNLSQQFGCSPSLSSSTTPLPPVNGTPAGEPTISRPEWNTLVQQCLQKPLGEQDLVPQKVAEIALNRPFSTLRMLAGWLISGFAIAMGAPFWFDLLNKVVNVRNTGSKPAAATETTPK